jgi:hypothetical protein
MRSEYSRRIVPFDKGMRQGDIWHSLDFSHIQNSKISFSSLKEKKTHRTNSLSREMPKAKADLLDNSWATPCRIPAFGFYNGINEFFGWSFGAGFSPALLRKRIRYFLFIRAWWRLNSVEGFSAIAERIRRAGFINREHTPAMKRSEACRFGARFRERFKISS